MGRRGDGEHGDLLDVIRESCGLIEFRDVADEARRFLAMPRPQPQNAGAQRQPAAARGSPTPRVACSPCRSRSPARWPNAILLAAASCLTARERSLRFHPAATTAIS
jgi:hypothetical protein